MNLTSFLVYCIIATFTPGPTNIVILSTVQHHGARQAMKYTYGAAIGFGLLLAVSAMLNTTMTMLPKVIIAMQIIGTFYMCYLALKIYHMDASNLTSNEPATVASGFVMQFLNPKVVVFALTVLPSYVLPYYRSSTAVTISIIGITAIGFAAFLTWVSVGTIFSSFLRKHRKVVNVLMAFSLVIYAAFMLWM